MGDVGVARWLVRSLFIVLVVGFVGLFLYSPRLKRFFYEERSINVLVWPTELDAEYLGEFEAETGIKVYVSYIETNEEMFVKLRSAQSQSYDLVLPSDYAVELMVKEGLLKKIDRTRLHFWEQLYPTLLGHYHDPHNEYSIPYFWDIYGLGIDKDYFGGELPDPSWALVFNEQFAPERVGMIEDRREIILIAAKYLFGTIDDINDPSSIKAIKECLRRQREWVEMYTDTRTGHLLASKVAPVVVTIRSDITRMMPFHKNVEFVMPKEGSFAIIDSFVIPRDSAKDDYIYQFLNYLYRPNVLQKYADKYEMQLASSVLKIPEGIPEELARPNDELFVQLDFFRNVIDESVLNKLWMAVVS